DLGATSVYVTHDQIEAMTMADRIVAMHDGIVQQVGTPLDIYDRPSNVFVASFIGSPAMNFLKGTFAARNGSPAVELGSVTLPAEVDLRQDQARRGTLRIRPEHIQITEDPRSPIEAKVDLIEPMGMTTLIHATLAGEDVKILALDRPALEQGAPVRLRFLDHKLHLFDAG